MTLTVLVWTKRGKSMSIQGGHIAAIILAAGESTRMGCPKLLLPFGGRRTIDRVLSCCRRGGVDEVNVVLGAHAETIRRVAALDDSNVLINPDPSRGMSSSIRQGVAALSPEVDAFLLFPADHPLVPPGIVRLLIRAFSRLPAGKRIIAPVYDKRRGHPVLFDRSLIPAFLALGENEPAYRVIRSRPREVLELLVDTPFVTTDMDTPEDYVRLREAYGQTEMV